MAESLALRARVRRHLVDVDLRLPLADSPVTVLFGPSGSGKTTLLRCLAGLDRPEQGRIEVAGEVWDDGRTFVPARRRRVGLLFQDHALFPHLSVDANVAYGLGRVPRRDRAARVAQALAAAGAAHLAGRPVRQLSGGEAQRVALARALAPRPRLLLLDEPLSALDTPTRVRLRTELRRMLSAAGVPSIVVTHDRGEALALGDRMAVLVDGQLQQVGDLASVFGRPATAAVAAAVGVESTLAGSVISVAGGLARVQVGAHQLTSEGEDLAPGEAVLVCIRAEDVAVELPDDAARTRPGSATGSQRNRLSGTVTAVAADGPLVRVDLDCDGVRLASYVTRLAAEDLHLRPGAAAVAVVKTTAIHLVPR